MNTTNLHERLRGPVAETLQKRLGITNKHALPRIEKVVVSAGINKSRMDSKEMHEYIADCLARITGQKPVFTKARKAISSFKVRQGMIVGAMVTLRGRRMEDFLDRLFTYGLPRIRDFRGLNTTLDGRGNYSIGIKDHTIFPEVPPADAKELFGLQVQITTTTEDDTQAFELLKEIGVPFRRDQLGEDSEETKEAKDSKVAGGSSESSEKNEANETVASEGTDTDTETPAS